jgi:hypothetical protein
MPVGMVRLRAGCSYGALVPPSVATQCGNRAGPGRVDGCRMAGVQEPGTAMSAGRTGRRTAASSAPGPDGSRPRGGELAVEELLNYRMKPLRGRGAPSSSSSTPCSSTSTGGITAAYTARLACTPSLRQRPPTTLNPRFGLRPAPNELSLYKIQGASVTRADRTDAARVLALRQLYRRGVSAGLCVHERTARMADRD